jgi:hypothetical protein
MKKMTLTLSLIVSSALPRHAHHEHGDRKRPPLNL